MRRFWTWVVFALVLGGGSVYGQAPKAETGQPAPVDLASPVVREDGRITFRIAAAKAQVVRLSAGDIPNLGQGANLTKRSDNVWETTVGPVPAGAYRYLFQVDGLAVVDPQNPKTSESNGNVWSLVEAPGKDKTNVKVWPAGAVAQVRYASTTLGRGRRMHVYTPPGYEKGDVAYPVLYLLHGATDSDQSWSTVGQAGMILDRLIAEGRAKPMLLVMPAGHTGPMQFGRRDNLFERQMSEFEKDFAIDLRPTLEKRYRVRTDRNSRAIAGLSMGGAQSLNIVIPNLQDYAYVGVFSSGVFGIAGGPFAPPGPSWEQRHKTFLEAPDTKVGLKLVWFATGKDDFLLGTSRATVKALKSHGFTVTYKETAGGHTWLVWRDYLAEFAPLLFRDS